VTLPKALLLDLDNTVLAFDQAVVQSWTEVCRDFAPTLGPDVMPLPLLAAVLRARDDYWADPVRNHWGRHNVNDAHRAVARLGLEALGLRKPSAASDMTQAYLAAFDRTIAPFPGALEALRALQGKGVLLGLVTNGGAEAQRRKIGKFALDTLVGAIAVEGELGFGKPDARAFRHVLDRLGVAPSEAWMAGDNLEHDVAGAQALGVHGIWVDWASVGLPEGSGVRPDRVIKGLMELLV